MPKPIELKRGDPCPVCGGELALMRGMTAEEHAKTYDRENPMGVSPYVDTAHPSVRAEIGELFKCRQCGYVARLPEEAAADETEKPEPTTAAGAGGAAPRRTTNARG